MNSDRVIDMDNRTQTISILGKGIWGSALGSILKRNGHRVRFWSRRSDESLASLLKDVDILVSAISMAGVSSTIDRVRTLSIPQNLILVTATKGLDPKTTKTPSQIWQAAFPKNPVVVLSGPNLSKEIQQQLPAATVVSSYNLAAAETIQTLFASDTFRVYDNQDPIGTELGGTLKNIMAIAAGVCDGMKLGTNAKAALLTRALQEMVRIGTHLGAEKETFFGLSGLGDLIATCESPLSRNYQVGYRLAEGKNLEQILAELEGTAEGINTTNVLIQIADREKIAVPIAREVDRLLKGKITPSAAVKALMERELKAEF
jgi:glycerol-3-phosphate dehydrogenase (NAD(P)+)